eukprot:1148622-Pelagomonas_calceolata.AAC.2
MFLPGVIVWAACVGGNVSAAMPKGRKCMEGNAYGSNGAPSLLSGLAYPPSDRAAAVQCTAGTHPDAQNAAHAAATQLLELKVRRLASLGEVGKEKCAAKVARPPICAQGEEPRLRGNTERRTMLFSGCVIQPRKGLKRRVCSAICKATRLSSR